MKRIFIINTFLLIFIGASAQSHYPGQHAGKLKENDLDKIMLQNFGLTDVRLLDSRFKDNMLRESKWILSFPVERLLHSFRTTAGVYSGYEGGHYAIEPLGGWESLDCELRGHAVGHILSGLALLYAQTGEEVYKVKADSLVTGLTEVQQTFGESGYLSAYPENLINRNLRDERVWAPWYTLHKLYSGLIDQYLYTDNQQALEVVVGMANWAYDKLSPLSEDQRKLMLRNEFGGMNDSFYALYSITGNEHDKWLAEFFYHNDVLDPLLAGEDILDKKHANTYIPKLIGLARAYELGGSEDYLKTANFFWKTTVEDHSFVTGSNSDKEKFFEAHKDSEHLSGYTGETCNVYNLLKLTRHLYSLNPSVEYADFYEKALYNHILGQQDPKSGMVAYFLPMLPGAHKVYSTYDQSFWCCVGTGFENHAKYGEFIYSYSDNDLYVNLFIPSVLNWSKKGTKITQENNFPYEPTTSLRVNLDKAQSFSIKIRSPKWATFVTIKVNGKTISKPAVKDGFISIDRKWKDGDQIKVDFGMKLKEVPTGDNKNIIAFTYGPVVLAGLLGTEGMTDPAPFSDPTVRNDYYTYDYKVPSELTNKINIDLDKLSQELVPMDEKLHFKMKDTGIILAPIADIHHERYVIYWEKE